MLYVTVMENFPIGYGKHSHRSKGNKEGKSYTLSRLYTYFKIKRTALRLNNLNTCMWDSIQMHYLISSGSQGSIEMQSLKLL